MPEDVDPTPYAAVGVRGDEYPRIVIPLDSKESRLDLGTGGGIPKLAGQCGNLLGISERHRADGRCYTPAHEPRSIRVFDLGRRGTRVLIHGGSGCSTEIWSFEPPGDAEGWTRDIRSVIRRSRD